MKYQEGKTSNISHTNLQICEHLLKGISQDDQLKRHDCVVVCLMGHGENGKIIDTSPEKKAVNIEKILGFFNCANLEEKPKLFFIQSCRKGQSDKESLKNVINFIVMNQNRQGITSC